MYESEMSKPPEGGHDAPQRSHFARRAKIPILPLNFDPQMIRQISPLRMYSGYCDNSMTWTTEPPPPGYYPPCDATGVPYGPLPCDLFCNTGSSINPHDPSCDQVNTAVIGPITCDSDCSTLVQCNEVFFSLTGTGSPLEGE